MSNDFEAIREHDEIETERIDPEEPETWESVKEVKPTVEADSADWLEQQAVVDDASFDEDEPV